MNSAVAREVQTPIELGKRATLSRSQLARLERSLNVEVSTLVRYVHAAGGRLEMSAIVQGKRLTILSEKEIR